MVGKRVQKSQDPDTEYACAIGPDTVLNDGALLALHPSEKASEREDAHQDYEGQTGFNGDVK